MKKTYTWIETYEKIADKVLEYKNDRKELLKIMYEMLEKNKVFSESDTINCNLDSFKGERIKYDDIDPFSFLNRFDIKYTEKTRLGLLKTFIDKTKLNIQVPEDLDGIPYVNPQNTALISFKDERKENDIDDFWNFYEVALAFANGDASLKEKFITLYDKLLGKKHVKWNLSISLFKIRPNFYINLDSTNREFLRKEFKIQFKNTPYNGEEYLNLLDRLKQIVEESEDYKSMVDFSHKAWVYSRGEKQTLVEREIKYGEDYDPKLSVEKWMELIQNEKIFNLKSLKLVKRYLDYGGEASCSEISQEYGESPWFYNSTSIQLAKRIQKETNIAKPKRKSSTGDTWWPILYTGRGTLKSESGDFSWKLRKNLKEALDRTDLSHIPLYEDEKLQHNYYLLVANPNYWSFKNINGNETEDFTALNENGNKRKIYQYFEEIKEGDLIIGYEANPIKEVVSLCKVVSKSDNNNFNIKKEKDFSKRLSFDEMKIDPILKDMEFMANQNGTLFKLKKNEYNRILELVGEKEVKETNNITYGNETVEIDLEDLFLPNEQIDEILNILERKKNIILQGVPGVGKTFVIKSILKSRWDISDENLITVQFHQSYSYEEFIEGLRPNENNSFEIKQGKFKEFVGKAIDNPEEKYFFIIDEINRGNLSKIFGELLMLIEDDKRGKETVYLPYSGEEFTVPENLYIVGTMNITDRSLSLVDYALRRRFSFFTLKPAFNTDKFNNFMLYKLNYTQEQLNKINNIMSQINKEITNRMGESFNIGHSYFIVKPKDRNNDFDKFLNEIFKYEILPLIEEYFFDDLEAIEKFKEIMELNGERN